jgi:hypothetical protein
VIVKSDNYAPASQDQLSNITIEPLLAAGDTKGMIIQGIAAPLSHISISNAIVRSPSAWGINVQGANATTPATALTLTNITVDYPGGSPPDEFCLQFVQYVSDVNISNLNCSNMWAGIAPYQPISGAFSDFTVMGSTFNDIASNGIEAYGQWHIFQTTFGSIAGNAIVSDSGITAVSRLSFNKIGVSDMYSAGGSFVVLKNGPHSR